MCLVKSLKKMVWAMQRSPLWFINVGTTAILANSSEFVCIDSFFTSYALCGLSPLEDNSRLEDLLSIGNFLDVSSTHTQIEPTDS